MNDKLHFENFFYTSNVPKTNNIIQFQPNCVFIIIYKKNKLYVKENIKSFLIRN